MHWASFTPRFHPSDFRIYSLDGVGVDWPISLCGSQAILRAAGTGDCRSPARPIIPWGDPHGYPYGPHPMGGVGDALIRGCTKLGIGVSAGGPVAILSGFARRSAALHLSRLLHPRLQGGRESKHADHARARRDRARRRNSRQLHGRRASSWARSARRPASPTSIARAASSSRRPAPSSLRAMRSKRRACC